MAVHVYTRYVKILRLVLPVIATLSLLSLLVWPFWREHRDHNEAVDELAKTAQALPHPDDNSDTLADTAVSPANAPLQVLKPDYQGLDSQGRPYHITAGRVEQNLNPRAPINLFDPAASLVLAPASTRLAARMISVRSQHGLYDATAQTLDLKGDIVVENESGMVLHAQDLAVDLNRFYAMTTTPVTGSGPQGYLSARALNIADKGAVIVLQGPSRLVLQPVAVTGRAVPPQPVATVMPSAPVPSSVTP